MKTCPKCTTELEDAATKCVSCGFQLEEPQRTLTGKVIKWLFIAFNLAMIGWVMVGMGVFDRGSQSSALPRGTENAEGMGVTMIILIWVICNLIFGLVVWDTRAKNKALQESHNKIEE
ncbi:hypothetical protein TKWG_14005 [Advenella kashmirensis WT001]|uniref:Zinc ribbon domain-containing protein n=1 Tax=Advenella kashmirensis (strain DSM 17095 / LMG 22695 / WT001) TaxID=1036672 RepID=I3UCZ5_ADVKW|nr:zinc ribbon domain-containing protein [Advenella kashmirensis]AFK62883.1 hypothetical protein TKWG_14005 [Advenella kashmirensis WT001]